MLKIWVRRFGPEVQSSLRFMAPKIQMRDFFQNQERPSAKENFSSLIMFELFIDKIEMIGVML